MKEIIKKDIDKQYQDLADESEDIIDFFNERLSQFAHPIDIKFYFQSNSKQKNQLIKISKIPLQYEAIINCDLLVQINTEYFDAFSTDSELGNINEILFDQELDKISVNPKTEKISLTARNIKASKGIIEKFSYEAVIRAEEIEELFEEQKKENKT